MSVFNKLKTLKDAIVGTNFRTGDGTGTTALGTKHLQVKDLQPYFNDGYTDSVEKRGGLTVNTKAFDWGVEDFSIEGIDGGVVTVTDNISIPEKGYTVKNGSKDWFHIAMSGTGQYQIGLAKNENPYISVDYGENWNPILTIITNPNHASISYNGEKMRIASGGVNDGTEQGALYGSGDYGATFLLTVSGNKIYTQHVISDNTWEAQYISLKDGTHTAAYMSHGSWTEIDASTIQPHVPTNFTRVAVSGDGSTSILLSIEDESTGVGYVWLSTNNLSSVLYNAVTVAPMNVMRKYYNVALSYDGQYITVCERGGGVWRSTDTGVSWSQVTLTAPYDMSVVRNYSAVVMSSTGQYQKLVADGEPIIESSDYGVTWYSSWYNFQSNGIEQYITMSSNSEYVSITAKNSPILVSDNYGIVTPPYSYLLPGDIFQISGARKFTNNGIYEVKSVVGKTITMESGSDFGKTTLTNDTKQTGQVHKVNVTTLTCDTDSFGQSVWKTKNGSSIVELGENELTLSTNRNRIEILPSTTLMYDQQNKLSGELPEVYIVETGSVENGEDVTLKLGDEIKSGTEVRVVRKGKNKVILTSTVGFDGEVELGSIDLDRDDQKVCLVYFSDSVKETWYIVG
jgi:hypothetical protein